jgi:hypothetical protein
MATAKSKNHALDRDESHARWIQISPLYQATDIDVRHCPLIIEAAALPFPLLYYAELSIADYLENRKHEDEEAIC